MVGQNGNGASGWVFNIQRYSVHDGPGIRTTVFLKGCPLRCPWCYNPESQRFQPQIVFRKEPCIHCDACLEVCSRAAIATTGAGQKYILPDRCDLCGRCLDECYSGALEQIGRLMTVAEVVAVVAEDQPFYEGSGGGMTLSGGEPTVQAGFCRTLLKACHELEIHTAIESCGHTRWEVWQSLLPYLDLILYDLKQIDAEKHKQQTGVSNRLILDNFRQLVRSGKRVVVRRPVIPGYNDSHEDIHALAKFVKDIDVNQEVNLLPYHRLGQNKYELLGQEYLMPDHPSLTKADVLDLQDILLSYGLRVKVGG
ncbi:MAG: Choline trimethylamine-lyase activating enzyme [Anaerolineae bacterium]|nr:Choline trimethylamine-lyase activating enzyme [Anaerolineae bacterium]